MPHTRKPNREARPQKPKPHLNTDIAAVKNATDMDDAKERRGAWLGLCLSLAPLVIIGLIILLQDLV